MGSSKLDIREGDLIALVEGADRAPHFNRGIVGWHLCTVVRLVEDDDSIMARRRVDRQMGRIARHEVAAVYRKVQPTTDKPGRKLETTGKLSRQCQLVLGAMRAGYRTLTSIASYADIAETSASARIRDLRNIHGFDVRLEKLGRRHQYYVVEKGAEKFVPVSTGGTHVA